MMLDGPPRGRGPYGPPRDFGGPPRGPMMGPPRDMGPPRMQEAEIVVDREKTCPLLLRVFYKNGGHHKLEEFAVGGVHIMHACKSMQLHGMALWLSAQAGAQWAVVGFSAEHVQLRVHLRTRPVAMAAPAWLGVAGCNGRPNE